MIPELLTKWFGRNWQTNLSAWLVAIAGFVAADPGNLFARWPPIVAIAKYFTVGGAAAGLFLAKDGKPRN